MEYCPECRTVSMEIVDKVQNFVPPSGLNWTPLAREFLIYQCPQCSYTKRMQGQPGAASLPDRPGNRDSAEGSGGGRLMGWIFAFDALVCAVQLVMLASRPLGDNGMIVFWSVGAILFGVTAQREFAQKLH